MVLDAAVVRRWCRLAADALGRTRGEIDALNVFPVPDGDTGTNLHLTVLAAADAAGGLPDGAGEADTWRAVSQAALLGARGNSGVILSQVLRGMADVLGAPARPGGAALAEALEHASVLARAAVEHPVEGTILSVLGEAAAAASAASGTDLAGTARAAADGARRALRRTTGQLDVLARSGVVDAGAAGLCVVLDALAAVVTDEYPEHYDVPARTAGAAPPPAGHAEPPGPGYEVMYLLDAPDGAVHDLRERLDDLGDSLVVVGGDGLWNVHVHVDDAGAAIEAGLAAGRPHRIRVTYLHAAPHRPHAGRAVIAVTAADGLAALLEEAGARVVRREPGAVPPLAVLAEAILAAGEEVVVLPDEPEVLALAEAAAERARDGGARIAVVPARASVQGLAALAVHDPLRRFGDDVIAMTRAAGATRFGHLEVAAEEAVTSVGLCRPGDVLGLIEGDVATIGGDVAQVARRVLDRMLSGGGELVTLIAGRNAPPGLAERLEDHLRGGHPDVEVGLYDGAQRRYPLLIGVE
ncbi:DAK2 domain-containing protein [Actinomadura violacea]|uniref:DAK2 domain-containing protein n=1 Tax=Actinomadura violacea TaxID=2819934 RepID=A0ABS3S207_9ACTN|nr:DAK2 domain-containing protein [Actinomadura violacea]MBO2463046.1 DAK2 domain-containing protein [Actinomadura violacea]